METDFFLEQLRIADIKVTEQNKIKATIKKSKSDILKAFAEPILNFLYLINDNYSFNKDSSYTHDKKLLSYNRTKEDYLKKFEDQYHFIDIPIIRMSADCGSFDYIQVSIDDKYNCGIKYTCNTTTTKQVFSDLQSFIENFSIVIAKNKD